MLVIAMGTTAWWTVDWCGAIVDDPTADGCDGGDGVDATFEERANARTVRGDCFGGADVAVGDDPDACGENAAAADDDAAFGLTVVALATILPPPPSNPLSFSLALSANTNRSVPLRSRPQIGSKCFSFHGSKRAFSFSTSARIFI